VLYQKEMFKTLQCHESLAKLLRLLHTLLMGIVLGVGSVLSSKPAVVTGS